MLPKLSTTTTAVLAPQGGAGQLRRWTRGLLVLLALILMVALLAWVFGPRGRVVDLVAKTWRLEIEVERRVLETGSGWCDELPEGALVLSRRSLDSDPSGQRQGPVEHCRYRSPQWRTSYVAQSQGQAPDLPQWPRPVLRRAEAEQQGLGAERLGKRQAFYELQLQSNDGRQWRCRQNLKEWQARPDHARWRMQVDRYGVADCASLPALDSARSVNSGD